MAIIRNAKNFKILTKKQDVIMTGTLTVQSKKMTLDAVDGNLEFNSPKKVIIDGRG